MRTSNKTLNKTFTFTIPAGTSLDSLWDMYNESVVELKEAEKKFAKAEKGHKEIVTKVLKMDEEEVLYFAGKVTAKLTKKNDAKREVEFVKGKIAKLKQAIVSKADELGL